MNNIIQTIRHTARAAAVLLIALLAAQTAWAQTNVSNASGLEDAFQNTDVSEINVTDDITGVGNLPPLNRALTINLNGHTISGDKLYFNVGPGLSLTINGGSQDGSVGNIISGYADREAIDNNGTFTLSHVNITTNYDCAIFVAGTLNIGNNVSFNGWTERPFDTEDVNIIGNYNYDRENLFANVVATVTVGGKTHYFENSGAALAYITNNADKVDFSWSESGNTYTIHTATGWDYFCDLLADNDKGYFTGKTVQLGADIGTADDPVTSMAGTAYHDFTGTFDGQGHTLTVGYGTADAPFGEQYAAPFRYIEDGCTIKNLHVAGHIYTSAKNAGGLAGSQYGDVTIQNCRSSVTIVSSVENDNNDGTHGGFIAYFGGKQKHLSFEGCLFDGKLLTTNGTSHCGGFVGWANGVSETTDTKVTFTNCLYAPAAIADADGEDEVGSSESATFARKNNNTNTVTLTITNCYYTRTLGDAQGKALHSVTAGDGVTIDAIALTGDATAYTVSGITAYSGGGLQRDENLYYGSGDNVSLTLSNTAPGNIPDGYQYEDGNGFTASAGTLIGSTLTMPDQDVTISPALRSTGEPVEVSYVDADGTTQPAWAIALDGTETSLGRDDDQETWYFVGLPTVAFDHMLNLNGDVHLILADGCTMNVTSSNADGIDVEGSLTIYGQTDGTGALNATSFYEGIYTNSGTITISGGRVTATSSNGIGILTDGGTITISGGRVTASSNSAGIYIDNSSGNLTISGGRVTATSSNGTGIYTNSGTITISGGRVTVTSENAAGISTNSGTITLGCTTASDFIYVSSYDIGLYGKLNIADGQTLFDEYGKSYSDNVVTIPDGKTLRLYGLALADAANNNAAIANNNGKTLAVALQGRTLYKDGKWNTLCLPFDMSELEGTPLAGATLMTLDTEQQNGFDTTGGTMYLSFKEATAIEAGVPYLVKWDKAEGYDANPSKYDVANPVFEGVTISSTAAQAVAAATDGMEAVQMVGTYSPVSVEAGDQSIMFLGTQNTLYYTTKGRDILSCRAYFAVPYIKDNAAAKVSAFTLNFNDEVTGITTTNFANEAGAWYTLDGRKLSGKPTKKGMYINSGKKIVIE